MLPEPSAPPTVLKVLELVEDRAGQHLAPLLERAAVRLGRRVGLEPEGRRRLLVAALLDRAQHDQVAIAFAQRLEGLLDEPLPLRADRPRDRPA